MFEDEEYAYRSRNRDGNQPSRRQHKWIHRYNEHGAKGIVSKILTRKPVKITPDTEKKIVDMATKNPRKEYGLPFSTWSLHILAGYMSKEPNLVDSISHIEIRNILLKHEIRYRPSMKITLGDRTDPVYHLKKRDLKN